jgi:hypothetical protein
MAGDFGNMALLVMDVQPGIVQRLPEPDGYIARSLRGSTVGGFSGFLVLG